jgi:hypothetical protein
MLDGIVETANTAHALFGPDRHELRGCRLPRINRPRICTCYLCPTHTAILRKDHPAEREALMQAFSQIKFV